MTLLVVGVRKQKRLLFFSHHFPPHFNDVTILKVMTQIDQIILLCFLCNVFFFVVWNLQIYETIYIACKIVSNNLYLINYLVYGTVVSRRAFKNEKRTSCYLLDDEVFKLDYISSTKFLSGFSANCSPVASLLSQTVAKFSGYDDLPKYFVIG